MAESTANVALPAELLEPRVTPRDRLSFTLFLAISIHLALILGVTFSDELNLSPSPTIEVTLATHDDQTPPEDADFIAEANQQASGTELEALEKTTDQTSEIFANEINELLPEPDARVEQTTLEEKLLLATEALLAEEGPRREMAEARVDQIVRTNIFSRGGGKTKKADSDEGNKKKEPASVRLPALFRLRAFWLRRSARWPLRERSHN